MKNTLLTRISVCLLAGLLAVLLIVPLGAQARVELTRDDGVGDEGDPLDSNDYTDSGGGGGSDSDVHDTLAAPADDGILRIIRTLLMDSTGALVLPTFLNGVPVIQIITPEMDVTAVPYAD